MERFALAPRYNIAYGQTATVIVDGEQRAMRWGLLAPWRGHGGKRGPMIYVAPADAIERTPVLRNAEPCRVPADGFYAWRRLGKKRIPYWIHPEPARPIAFAARWTTHRDDGIASFAIVTVPAAPLVAPITPTMPVLVDDTLDNWRADAISNWVNDLAHDDAQCIAPLGNPAQGELF